MLMNTHLTQLINEIEYFYKYMSNNLDITHIYFCQSLLTSNSHKNLSEMSSLVKKMS